MPHLRVVLPGACGPWRRGGCERIWTKRGDGRDAVSCTCLCHIDSAVVVAERHMKEMPGLGAETREGLLRHGLCLHWPAAVQASGASVCRTGNFQHAQPHGTCQCSNNPTFHAAQGFGLGRSGHASTHPVIDDGVGDVILFQCRHHARPTINPEYITTTRCLRLSLP